MKVSTATRIAIVLGIAAILFICTYFYLDEKGMMIPVLEIMFLPFLTITMPPVVILLAAIIVANNKEEKEISGKTFKRALVIIGALLSYKLFTGYFSK